MNPPALYKTVFWVVIAASLLVRTWQFSETPGGLNQDEVSAAYEAWSLLETGKDRWGNSYPVYFPSWGSGQNVLYSYLTVPFFFVFGANDFSFRLPNLLLSLLSLLLIYHIFKLFNQRQALVAICVLGFSPWHIVLSRWALEVNSFPFWIFLHFFLLFWLMKHRNQFIWLSFIPLVFASYTYAIALFSFPLYFLLLIFMAKEISTKQLLIGFSAYSVLSLPLLLFVLKPYFSFIPTDLLGLSLPDLASARENFQENWKSVIHTNLQFIFRGFHDVTLWNTTMDSFPHSSLVLCSASLGGVIVGIKHSEKLSYKIWIAAFAAAAVPFFLFKMNLNRAILMQLMLIILSIEGIGFLLHAIQQKNERKLLIFFLSFIFLVHLSWFTLDYFRFYPKKTNVAFATDLEEVLNYLSTQKEEIYITEQLEFPYLYVAFYNNIHPKEFQELSKEKRMVEGRFIVDSMHNYHYFYKKINPLKTKNIPQESLVLLKKGEQRFIKESIKFENSYWKIVQIGTLNL